MAGSYPDHPSRRMPIDAIGVVGLYGASGNPPPDWASGWTQFTSGQMTDLNDDDNVTVKSQGGGGLRWRNAFIYPELWELDGFFVSHIRSSGTPSFVLQSSTDTTNGVDGSWDSETAVTDSNYQVRNEYRNEIVSAARSNRRGVRFEMSADGGGSVLVAVHLYGTIASGQTPDRLLVIDNGSGTEFGTPIDYGDIPRGSADEDIEIKLRNNSSTLSASSVQVTAEALYQSMASWFQFTESGGAGPTATLALASSISASSDSPVITVRRDTPDSSALSLHEGRIYANVGSWA